MVIWCGYGAYKVVKKFFDNVRSDIEQLKKVIEILSTNKWHKDRRSKLMKILKVKSLNKK